MQAGEARIAGGDAVLALVLQVVEEREPRVDAEVFEDERVDTPAESRRREPQQELERVAVREDRVRADVALGGQVLVEEGVQVSAEDAIWLHG